MPFITTDDLAEQALWMSGEPTDGTSDYVTQVLSYLQSIYDVLITGGTFGTRDIATSAGLYSQVVNIAKTDWLWLRKNPPFAFNTVPACIGSSSSVPLNQGTQAGTMTLTFGSTTVTFDIAPSWNIPGGISSVNGGRVMVLTQEQGVPNPPITVPRISAHSIASLSATLDAAWPQETQTVTNWVIYKSQYSLPADFERFCEAWKVQGGLNTNNQPLNVGNVEQMTDLYPFTDQGSGPPSAGARVDPSAIVLNNWDTFSYRVEGSYIFTPPTLVLNDTPSLQEPLVPVRFRQVLALGAAMMIMQDKVDSRCEAVASQFREMISTMSDEYRKEQNSSSELSGRMLYRRGGRRPGWLRTRSGLPFWP